MEFYDEQYEIACKQFRKRTSLPLIYWLKGDVAKQSDCASANIGCADPGGSYRHKHIPKRSKMPVARLPIRSSGCSAVAPL